MLGRRRRAEDPDTGPGTRIKGRHGGDTVTTVLDPMELLSTPISDGDLTVALARRPKARLPSLTMTLVMAVVLGLGFLGGALVGKHYGSSGSSSAGFGAFTRFGAGGTGSTSSSASSAPSGSSGFPGGSRLFGSGGATFGTIKLVDGNIVYVETETGSIVQVTTSAATKVTVSSSVPLKDLTPGETVIVEGTKNSNGSVAATSISQSSLGGGAG
jgi:hypothetical protein